MLFYISAKLKRNFRPFLALILFSGLIVVLIGGLERAQERKKEEFDNIRNEIEITCSVTNLTGTQRDGLSLPMWVVRLFDAAEDTEFVTYVHKVQFKVTRELGAPYNCELVGMNSILMASELYPENGCTIFWKEGYDEEIFASGEAVCIVPDNFRKLEEVIVRQTSSLDLTTEVVLKVVGTYMGGNGNIYCPWDIMLGISEELNESITADAITATLKDNDRLEEFYDISAEWFATPSSSGEKTPWEGGITSYYPYALDINDSYYLEAQKILKRDLAMLDFAAKGLLVLSLAAGIIVSLLMINYSAKELALMQTLGTPKLSAFMITIAEQFVCVLAGFLIGGIPFAWQPLEQTVMFCVFYTVGALIATIFVLNKNLIAEIKGNNE